MPFCPPIPAIRVQFKYCIDQVIREAMNEVSVSCLESETQDIMPVTYDKHFIQYLMKIDNAY